MNARLAFTLLNGNLSWAKEARGFLRRVLPLLIFGAVAAPMAYGFITSWANLGALAGVVVIAGEAAYFLVQD